MKRYKITTEGLREHLMYSMDNSNSVSLEEKLLAILSSGLGYTPSSLYGCVKGNETIKRKAIGEGSVTRVLEKFYEDGLVTCIDDGQ